MSTIQIHADRTQSVRPATPLPLRLAVFAYGLVAYASFFAIINYSIGFVGNWLVPKSIDSGTPGPVFPSLLINAALFLVFVAQHTVMARPAFKRWWTSIVPKSIERSTYVLAASASLALLFWQWRPLTQELWNVGPGWPAYLLSAVSILGWVTVFLASFMVSHFDLFGLRQVWFGLVDRPYVAVGFRLIGLYKIIRHPLMVGFLIAVWATPVMTLGHLAFAALLTLYIRFGTWCEERDLVAEHGEDYLAYRRAVPGFIPRLGRKGGLRGAERSPQPRTHPKHGASACPVS